MVRALADAGFDVNVMVAPVLPYLTDSRAHLDELFGAIAEAGAASAIAFPMHLRGSTRGWFLGWLAEAHPALLRRYRQLYGRGAYVTPEYSTWLRGRTQPLLEQHGLAREAPPQPQVRPPHPPTADEQLSLFA
jgi:DNA repair photolyase